MEVMSAEADFEKWLRTVCFQQPTTEAYDLAKDAYLIATRHAAQRCMELARKPDADERIKEEFDL